MPSFRWEVFVPGSDLPHAFETDYLLAEGDVVEVAGRWLVESVEIDDDLQQDDEETLVGIVRVAPVDEPV